MLVVDASFIAAAIFDEEHTAFTQRVLADNLDLTAPDLISWELTNIAWKKVRRGHIQEQDLKGFTSLVRAFDIVLVESSAAASVGESAQAALERGLTAYDAAYFQLARDRGLRLGTADKGLSDAAVAAGLVVHSPFA